MENIYKEHDKSVKYNRDDSAHAMHILNNQNTCGKLQDINDKAEDGMKGNLH